MSLRRDWHEKNYPQKSLTGTKKNQWIRCVCPRNALKQRIWPRYSCLCTMHMSINNLLSIVLKVYCATCSNYSSMLMCQRDVIGQSLFSRHRTGVRKM